MLFNPQMKPVNTLHIFKQTANVQDDCKQQMFSFKQILTNDNYFQNSDKIFLSKFK